LFPVSKLRRKKKEKKISEEMDTGVVLPRKQADYTCRDERYCLSMQRYKGQQYSQLYFFRLHTIRQNLLSRVQERWPSLPVCKVLGLEEGQLCVVVGTLYKQMQLKPSILEEYSKERSVVLLATPSKFTHNDDYLIMEDESGRVKLIRDAKLPSFYVTG
jgi:DNA polymerase delta subunit 2